MSDWDPGKDDHVPPWVVPLHGRYTRTGASPTSFGFIGRFLLTLPLAIVWLAGLAMFLSAEGKARALAMVFLGIMTLQGGKWLRHVWAREWTGNYY